MNLEKVIEVYPHRLFTVNEKRFIFMGYGSSLYELNQVEDYIISNEGKEYFCIENQILDKFSDIDKKKVKEIIKNLKNNGIIRSRVMDDNIKNTIDGYTWHGDPDTAILLLCQECNLRCKYCYAGQGEYLNPGIMPEEIGKKAIDFIANLNEEKEQFNLIFFGGEPLMDFKKVKNLVA